jgi:RimJ/RimL family protein N-acetyltransferase
MATFQAGNMKIQLKIPSWQDMHYIRWLWKHEETMEPVGGAVHLTEDQAIQWYRRMIDPGNPADEYRLILNEELEPVGEVSFHQFNLETGTAMFNLKIASAERGKGYAWLAMREFLDMFFNELGGRTMLDDIALNNLRGREVLIEFGFVHEPCKEDVFKVYITKNRFNQLYRSE